ncbi:DNA-binding protein [Mycobacterium koreense]|uniref:Uncharacterized protein n=1 Tax=Mycolicibacillus koreensis TaxID=1069220 RepID=A0A7I7S7T9_9MYCO|nr:helix-turn-helix domain-containing protein [Mycolicibacillus koreensis]MCV7249847.1 DNA-binding protein [Mycolicibacillus koreensis]OSC25101.1 hypothetical protein B8W67_19190 [Mycolicibacillus koreensis]BBY52944.1 hypothetical protein MKOR_01950 [Mycolicibacillus koreensis]
MSVQHWPGVVVVSGPALRAAADAVLIAIAHRRRNGLPRSGAYDALARAFLGAMSDNGQTDTADVAIPETETMMVAIGEAAATLGVSQRHARRLAPQLGGKRIGGRWFLDTQAIDEHLEGTLQHG